MSKKSNVKVLRIILLVAAIVALVYCFACLTGCTEDQIQSFNDAVTDPNGINKVVKDVNSVAGTVNYIVTQSPASAAIPTDWKFLIFIGTTAVSIAANAWQKFRNSLLSNENNLIAKKYTVMKTAQAKLKLEDPKAEEKLYAINGVERVAQGVS